MLFDNFITEEGDVAPYVMSDQFCCISAKLNNDFTGKISAINMAGLLLSLDLSGSIAVATIIDAGAATYDLDGICLTSGLATIESGENHENLIKVLVRGPAIINTNVLPAADPEGTAYDGAKLTTALEDAERIPQALKQSTNLGGDSTYQQYPVA